MPLQPGVSLQGLYQVLTLTEKPYTDTDYNDLVLFDTLSQGCGSEPIFISFSRDNVLTTDVAPACAPYTTWLAEAGLINASQWEMAGESLVVTSSQYGSKSYAMAFDQDQLELSWEGDDSHYMGLQGQMVTYSLVLKKL